MSKSTNKVPVKKDGEEIKPQKPLSKGKTASEIMSRHISNKNDVITEEEFKELNLDTNAPGNITGEAIVISGKHNRPKDEDKDPENMTPWDVIT